MSQLEGLVASTSHLQELHLEGAQAGGYDSEDDCWYYDETGELLVAGLVACVQAKEHRVSGDRTGAISW